VAELLVVHPLFLQAEVEHGESRVSGHLDRVPLALMKTGFPTNLLVNVEELREPVCKLRVGQSGVGLQQHQAFAPS